MIEGHRYAGRLSYADFRKGGVKAQELAPGEYYHPTQLIPFAPGCALLLSDQDGGGHVELGKASGRATGRAVGLSLDLPKLVGGWHLMQTLHPQHFADVIAGNDDAATGDVYLQLCVFGQVIYG